MDLPADTDPGAPAAADADALAAADADAVAAAAPAAAERAATARAAAAASRDSLTGLSAGDDPEWYKRAVFYEVLVRGFADSDGNGSGDLRGLISKLDYLRWLGIDSLWLPPFYPSPLRDGGYDISDFVGVLPEFGTVEDFRRLLDEAHARGMRVIVDFVMNHTSDQHPWFQASRADPYGPSGSDRDARNHGCWSLVWFMTRSAMTRMPRLCASSTISTKSPRSPNSGRIDMKSLMS